VPIKTWRKNQVNDPLNDEEFEELKVKSSKRTHSNTSHDVLLRNRLQNWHEIERLIATVESLKEKKTNE